MTDTEIRVRAVLAGLKVTSKTTISKVNTCKYHPDEYGKYNHGNQLDFYIAVFAADEWSLLVLKPCDIHLPLYLGNSSGWVEI